MLARRTGILLAAAAFAVAGAFSPAEAAPALRTTCGGILSTQCANSSSLTGHTHGCSTNAANTTRTCLVHWHGTSSCNGTTSGTCTAALNATSDGSDNTSCTYGTNGNCSTATSTPGNSVSFPRGTTRTSFASLTTTANGGLLGTASEPTSGSFTYS